MAASLQDPQFDEMVKHTTKVSILLRKMIAAQMPTGNTELMTISVPGTIIDTSKDGEMTLPESDIQYSIRDARLVDRMIGLEEVQLGRSNRSVARSYYNAIEKLVPTETAFILDPKNTPTGAFSPNIQRRIEGYKNAMSQLRDGEHPVSEYVQKQKAWTTAQGKWDDAKKRSAEFRASNKEKKPGAQKNDQLLQSDIRRFKAASQAAWMDWVTMGHKVEIDYFFAIADTQTILARIEQSKEAMRNSMIMTDEGMEYYSAKLSPPTWGALCIAKATKWADDHNKYDVAMITSEIRRLQLMRDSFTGLGSYYQSPGAESSNIWDLEDEPDSEEKKVGLTDKKLKFESKALKLVLDPAVTEEVQKQQETARANLQAILDEKTLKLKTMALVKEIIDQPEGYTGSFLLDGTKKTELTTATNEKTGDELFAAQKEYLSNTFKSIFENEVNKQVLSSAAEGELVADKNKLATSDTDVEKDIKKKLYGKQLQSRTQDTGTSKAYENLYRLEADAQTASQNLASTKLEGNELTNLKAKVAEKVKAAKTARQTLKGAISMATKAQLAKNQQYVQMTAAESRTAQVKYTKDKVNLLNIQIASLEDKLDLLLKDQSNQLMQRSIITDVTDDGDVRVPKDEQQMSAIFKSAARTGNEGNTAKDAWTRLSSRFSANSSTSSLVSTSNAFEAKASLGFSFPFFERKLEVSTSHADSSREAHEEMAKCEVVVSMSVMKVEIERPWLHAELFQDVDLDVPESQALSPGAARLKHLVKSNDHDALARYGEFASYPTSFIIAADTDIEFIGATSKMESHLSSSSTEGKVGLSWGPFSIEGGGRREKENQSQSMTSTGTGIKISFQAPQIIAWTSELLPALPRIVQARL